jgi:hypothetical protein
VQTARSEFSSFLAEQLAAVTQIQLLGQGKRQEQKASGLLRNVVSSQVDLARTGILFSALSNLGIVSGIAVILGCGS